MLKISVTDSENMRLLVLEGKLVAPWTDELRSMTQGMAGDSEQRELIIDVSGVTAISADGEEVLLRLIVGGAKFRQSGAYMRQVLKQLARRADRETRRGIYVQTALETSDQEARRRYSRTSAW
jgi:anti-anti-sigma regulatory factor